MLNHPVRRVRRGLLLAVLALVAGATACEDPFEITAQFPNIDQTFELWAISGSPAAYPSGLLLVAPGLPQATAVRLDAAGNFDIAVDIDTLGRLRVLPVGSIVSPITGTRVIQFQRPTVSYSVIPDAPRDGWSPDSVLLVGEGQAFLLRISTQYCQFDIRQDIYAKFYVDSIIPDERRVKLRSRINPNCGFRSLLNGIPEY
jgi:hypothetical protein